MNKNSLAYAITEGFSDSSEKQTKGQLSEELNLAAEEFVAESLEQLSEGKKKKLEGEMEGMSAKEKKEYLESCAEDDKKIDETLAQVSEGDAKEKCIKEMEGMTTKEKKAYIKKCKDEGILDKELKLKF